MEALRRVERFLLEVELNGYPIGPDWMSGYGWKIAFDLITTVVVLMTLSLALFGLYVAGVRAISLIAQIVD